MSKFKTTTQNRKTKSDCRKTTLENGLRILTIPMPQSPSATAMVFVKVGSRYEPENLAGIAHFIEHNVFKGTKKRPSALQISSEIDGLGGVSNAGTTQEYTEFWVKLAAEHINKALDLVLDIALNPIFPKKDLEIERGNVIEEIRMYQDTPMWQILFDYLYFVWDKHPIGRYISGWEKTIKTIKQQDMLKFVKKYYQPQKMLVVVAGKIDEKAVVNQLKHLCEHLRQDCELPATPVSETQANPRVHLITKDTQQTHFCLGFKAFDRHHSDRIALELLNTILGQGRSSRLFVKVRDELGLAYYVSSSYYDYDDTGLWFAHAGVNNKRVEESIRAILNEYQCLTEERVSEKELIKAKEYAKGCIKLGVETSGGLGSWYGLEELLEDEVLTPDEYCQRIDAVTAVDLQQVAQTLLRKDRLNLGVIGPIADKEALAEELEKVQPLQRLNLHKG